MIWSRWLTDANPNFFATPIRPYDTSIRAVLQHILTKVHVVHHYDTVLGAWLSYFPDAEENTLHTIEDGKGYTIIMLESTNIFIGGVILTEISYPVYTGWNLIGYTPVGELKNMTVGEYFASIKGKYIEVRDEADRVLDDSDELLVGYGYWLEMIEPGIIKLSAPLAEGKAEIISIDLPDELYEDENINGSVTIKNVGDVTAPMRIHFITWDGETYETAYEPGLSPGATLTGTWSGSTVKMPNHDAVITIKAQRKKDGVWITDDTKIH